jgi:hypothetical protein
MGLNLIIVTLAIEHGADESICQSGGTARTQLPYHPQKFAKQGKERPALPLRQFSKDV